MHEGNSFRVWFSMGFITPIHCLHPSDYSPMSPSTVNTPSALPSLPRISSQLILEQIFTHRSLYRRPKRVFEDSPSDATLDNEQ